MLALLCALPVWRALPARSLCDAARAQQERLEPYVRGVMQGAQMEHVRAAVGRLELVRSHLLPSAFGPNHVLHHKQRDPTRVVRMDLLAAVLETMLADARRVLAIQERVRLLFGDANVSGYTSLSLEFENAVLFYEGCHEFWRANEARVRREFPELASCHCNIFTVSQGSSEPYGLHHATALGHLLRGLHRRGWLAPKLHKSFHTAVTAVDHGGFPFTVFEEHIPESIDPLAALQQLRANHSGAIVGETESLLLTAVSAFNKFTRYPLIPESRRRTMMDYVNSVFFGTLACHGARDLGNGTYWELEPGEALHFNNWRLHSDHAFGRHLQPRVTADLRCFSPMVVPWPFRDMGELNGAYQCAEENEISRTGECLLRLFDYGSVGDFYRTVFGEKVPQHSLSYVVGSLFLHYFADHDYNLLAASGIRRHYERVRRMYDSNSLNYSAFSQCAATLSSERARCPLPLSSRAIGKIKLAVVVLRLVLGDVFATAAVVVSCSIPILGFVSAWSCWRARGARRGGSLAKKRA